MSSSRAKGLMNMTFLCVRVFFSEAVFIDQYVRIIGYHENLDNHVVDQKLHHNSSCKLIFQTVQECNLSDSTRMLLYMTSLTSISPLKSRVEIAITPQSPWVQCQGRFY